jgi:hypothetical protein
METEFLNRHGFNDLYKLLVVGVFIFTLMLLVLDVVIIIFVVRERDAMEEGNKTLKQIAAVLDLLS